MKELEPWLQELLKNEKIAADFYRPNEYGLVPYLVKDGQRHPFAIICPGGGYNTVCSYVEGEPFARKLNTLGIHAFVLYYRVREKARFPGPQDDLARALREVLDRAEEWCLDTENYSIWGSSAGGHLVSSFGTEAVGYARYGLPRPGALVLIYPVVTMGPLSHGDTRRNMLGETPTAAEVALLSAEAQVTENYPPTFLWAGDQDGTVHPDNSRNLAAALEKAGVPRELRIYPGIDHGVGLGEGTVCEEWFQKAVAFWQRQR